MRPFLQRTAHTSEVLLCCTERELVLLKIRAPPGPTRTEVMQLIDIFRARVVDVSDRSLTIAVTGDAGKVQSSSQDPIRRNPPTCSVLQTLQDRITRPAFALRPIHTVQCPADEN